MPASSDPLFPLFRRLRRHGVGAQNPTDTVAVPSMPKASDVARQRVAASTLQDPVFATYVWPVEILFDMSDGVRLWAQESPAAG